MPAEGHGRKTRGGGRRARGPGEARSRDVLGGSRGRRARAPRAVARASLTRRRLVGLDRSVVPPATRRGQPLRPFTIPNAIGFARLALIPVFLVLGLSSGDGRAAGAAVVYAVIGGSDYLDGLAARLTGQYSRLGALLDPLTDRVLVVAGVVVTWHFELLPR